MLHISFPLLLVMFKHKNQFVKVWFFKKNSIPNSKLVVSSFSLADSQRQIPTSEPHKKLSNARVMPVGDVDIYLKVHT